MDCKKTVEERVNWLNRAKKIGGGVDSLYLLLQ